MFRNIVRHLQSRRGWRAGATALGLGALAALALPPLHVVPVLLLALPGLLVLVAAQSTWRGALWMGFWWGFGFHLFGLYWITEAILIEAARFWWLVPLAVPALSAVLAVFIAAPTALSWWLAPGWTRAVGFAAAFVLGEMLRGVVLTGFPWNPIGSVWAFGALFLQPASWVGVFGLSLLTLLVALSPLAGRRGLAGAAAGLAVWAGAGMIRLATPEPAVQLPGVVVVQGNVAQDRKWDRASLADHFRRHLALTAQGLREAARPAVVVWPETASPYLLESDPVARQMIAAVAGDVPVLAGGVRFDAAGQPRNSLIAVLGEGAPAAIYDKAHLVPFGEFQPSWARVGVQLVQGGGFTPGPGPATLRVPGLPPVGPSICYEAIFPGAVVDAADRPRWMVNVTNDAWFGSSAGPYQHLAAARLRAVEEGLPLVRAANTGISAVFDASGRTVARLGIGEAGVIIAPLPGARPPTLFNRIGNHGAMSLVLIMLIFAGVRTINRQLSKFG